MTNVKRIIEALQDFRDANSEATVFVGTQGTLCVVTKKNLTKEEEDRVKRLGWQKGGKEWFLPLGG